MYLFFIYGGLGKKKNVSPGIKTEAETFFTLIVYLISFISD